MQLAKYITLVIVSRFCAFTCLIVTTALPWVKDRSDLLLLLPYSSSVRESIIRVVLSNYMKRHGKYTLTKTGDDKLCEVQKPKWRKKRRDSLDNCCQTPSNWKELTNYDINNLMQDTFTEKSTKNSRENNSTSCRVIDESRPIEEQAIGNNRHKWKMKEMMKLCKRKQMIRTKRKRKTMREETQIA